MKKSITSWLASRSCSHDHGATRSSSVCERFSRKSSRLSGATRRSPLRPCPTARSYTRRRGSAFIAARSTRSCCGPMATDSSSPRRRQSIIAKTALSPSPLKGEFMSTQSAHKGIIHTIRQKLATWLHEPTETPWQRFRAWGYDTPEPMRPSQPLPHVPLIDGIAGGGHWSGPLGSWSAIQTGRLPVQQRETSALARPVPVSDVPVVSSDWLNSKPDERERLFADAVNAVPADDADATVLTPRAKRNKEFKQAISGLLESE